MKVAFIGLGIMGSRMAQNLLAHKVDLTVYNRTQSVAKNLGDSGAKVASTANEAVADADLVITMLSKPEVVEAVMMEDGGALQSMKPQALWMDCSTVNPSFSRSSAAAAVKQNLRFLDAPVAGTKPHAANAQLIFFVGGDPKDVEEATPLMEMMGQKILHIGETAMGSSFKMLVNSMLAQSMLMFAETVVLGEKMGMDRQFLLDRLPGLVVSPPFIKSKAEMIRNEDYEVMFPLELMHKDLHLVSQTAYELNIPQYLAGIAKEVYAKANQSGLGRKDFGAIFDYIQSE